MNEPVFLVSPVAPSGEPAVAAPQPPAALGTPVAPHAPVAPGVAGRPLRLGLLDNGKFNAAELLAGIAARLQSGLPVTAVTRERKYSMSSPASPDALDRLAKEADVVISAMAD